MKLLKCDYIIMKKSIFAFWITVIITALFLVVPAGATEPIFISGGISPNHKLAIVAYDNVNWNKCDFSEQLQSTGNIYLYDKAKKRNIGVLEEVDGTGGGFGTTVGNISVDWSPDSQFVAITFRCGRMNHDIIVYRIESDQGVTGCYLKNTVKIKAVPQELPPPLASKIGKEIFENAQFHSNGGSHLTKWIKNDEFSETLYHLMPKDFNKRLHPMINSSGEIEVIYKYQDGNWEIKKFNKLPNY